MQINISIIFIAIHVLYLQINNLKSMRVYMKLVISHKFNEFVLNFSILKFMTFYSSFFSQTKMSNYDKFCTT